MKLTQQIVDRLALAKSKDDEIFHDDDLPRFGLRLRKGGSRKWVVHYRLGGRQHRYTVGNATAMTLGEARQRARKVLVAVDDGRDPATEKAEHRTALALRFDTVLKDYLGAREQTLRPRTYAEVKRYLGGDYWKPFHRIALTSVTKAMVATELRRITKESGAVTSDRARTVLSGLYGWAVGEGLARENPVLGTNNAAPGKNSRDRVLSDAELAAVYRAAPDGHYGLIVRLLALTAQRRQEIGGLEWREVILDGEAPIIALPGTRTKNHLPHDIPLVPAAVEILKQLKRRDRMHVFGRSEDNGFRGWAYGKAVIDEASGVKDWTLHDLRRTAATRMGDLGVLPHVIEAILNHISGHKSGVAGIYNRSIYAAEKRAALELWATHLRAAIDGAAHD